MTKTWMTVLACAGILCGTAPARAGTTSGPKAFVLDKLTHHDLVFLGTTHRQPVILDFLVKLVPRLHDVGVTHLAMEIGSDQQQTVEAYLRGEAALSAIQLHRALECKAYRALLRSIRDLPSGRRPRMAAIDLPAHFFKLDLNRDQWMASRLFEIMHGSDRAKILVVLGSVHVLRRLPWQAHRFAGQRSIRAILEQYLPDLRVASIINVASRIEKNCDFARVYGKTGTTVALDLDPGYDSWELGPIQCMALRPAPVRELVEAVIVHP